MGLYEQIRDIAKSKGYSVNKLEQELGFARSSINKFNKNRPSLDKIQTIADFLNVSVDYLMTGKENTEDTSQSSASAFDSKLRNDAYLMQMLEKIQKLENEHDREILMSMIDTMLNNPRK